MRVTFAANVCNTRAQVALSLSGLATALADVVLSAQRRSLEACTVVHDERDLGGCFGAGGARVTRAPQPHRPWLLLPHWVVGGTPSGWTCSAAVARLSAFAARLS